MTYYDLPFFILTYILTLMFAGSFLIAWFKSDLPVLLCQIVAFICRNKKSAFWVHPEEESADCPLEEWTRDMWKEWSSVTLPITLNHLLNCPTCMSWHASFWCGVIGGFFAPYLTWQFPLICAATLPLPLFFIYKSASE